MHVRPHPILVYLFVAGACIVNKRDFNLPNHDLYQLLFLVSPHHHQPRRPSIGRTHQYPCLTVNNRNIGIAPLAKDLRGPDGRNHRNDAVAGIRADGCSFRTSKEVQGLRFAPAFCHSFGNRGSGPQLQEKGRLRCNPQTGVGEVRGKCKYHLLPPVLYSHPEFFFCLSLPPYHISCNHLTHSLYRTTMLK